MNEIPSDKWNAIMEKYPPGTIMAGTVIACPAFGVFVQLDDLPNVKALLPVIDFEWNEIEPRQSIKWPDEYPKVGSKINVRVAYWGAGVLRLTQLSPLD